MYESILQGALDLPLEQKKSLTECLKGAVLAQMSSVREGEPDECPRCHHGHVVRKGRAKDGSQRWLCRGCGRTFGAGTLGLLARSKLAPGVWASYVEDMVAGESLQRCADLCGMCLKTSWFCWTEQVRRSDASATESPRAHVANGTYRVTRAMLTDEPQPFWEYWEGRLPEVTEDDLWGPEAMSILV